MKQYISLITKVINEGVNKEDRTGTGTISIFGHQSVYDLREGFPLLTLKKTHWKSIVIENLWFLQGGTNTKFLKDNGVTIWDEWADENGNLGPIYGKQWTNWERPPRKKEEIESPFEVNQITNIINQLQNSPDDRGIIVSAWNAGELEQMALRPCHALFQMYTEIIKPVERVKLFNEHAHLYNLDLSGMSIEHAMEHYKFPKKYISLQLYQRSADVFLGVPFNIAGYSLLLHMIGNVVNMVPKKFVHTFGDAHIYSNHKEQVNTLLNRTRLSSDVVDFYSVENADEYVGDYMGPHLPKLKIKNKTNIFDYKFEDFELINYKHLGPIKAPVAI